MMGFAEGAGSDHGGTQIMSTAPGSSDTEWRTLPPLPTMQPACCCSAKPVVIVVMPAVSGRASTDLLMCGHHFRVSRPALAAAGAAVFDAHGTALPPTPSEESTDAGRLASVTT
jgi:hypothetical protein